jgi:hypothetical protein
MHKSDEHKKGVGKNKGKTGDEKSGNLVEYDTGFGTDADFQSGQDCCQCQSLAYWYTKS